HRRVEALDGPQQAEVALLDQVLQAKAFAGVAAGDVDDEAEVGADHLVAGGLVAVLNAVSELLFLVGGKKRGLIDLAEISLQRRLDGLAAEPARSSHGESPVRERPSRARGRPHGRADE